MSQIETSTETVERLAKHHDLLHPKVETVTLFGKTSAETAQVLRDLASERDQALARERALLDSNQEARDFLKQRDTLSKQVEDTTRVCAEQAEEILRLQGQLAEARNAALEESIRKIKNSIPEPANGPFSHTNSVRVSMYDCVSLIEALKSSPAPRQTVQEASVLLLDLWNRKGLDAMAAHLRALAQEGQADAS